jgi:hypothetical protein
MAARLPDKVQRAKETLVRALAAEKGFVGAGVAKRGSGRYEIVVMVVELASPVRSKVPHIWQGVPVRMQVSGVPRKF